MKTIPGCICKDLFDWLMVFRRKLDAVQQVDKDVAHKLEFKAKKTKEFKF